MVWRILAGQAVRRCRLGAQGQKRGQLPRISQRVTRGGTVPSAQGGGVLGAGGTFWALGRGVSDGGTQENL